MLSRSEVAGHFSGEAMKAASEAIVDVERERRRGVHEGIGSAVARGVGPEG